uniref:Integrase catalytic domain-containing protein n=1 Tax=Nicotiana tabacum TaxID=4097 RepID=A0A1S3ZHL8_TOBAC|nr:PREDICTED: uncharacterized protein LOC107786926 [Nicotiana tabacum]
MSETDSSMSEMAAIDHNHPLYIRLSDTPSLVVVPVKLTGSENYGLWSRLMRIALMEKKKLGFVTGGVMYASDAHLVWEYLRERFNKELWHEYDVLVPFPNCCEKSKDHAENLHQQRVMQFLSGLNESYDQARRAISYASRKTKRKETISSNGWNGTNTGKPGWNNPNAGKHGGNGVGKPGGWRREPMAMINNADVSTSSVQDMGDSSSGAAEHKGYHYFTKDQYNQILSLLNKESGENQSNMVGTGEVKCLMSSFTQKSQEKEWVVDLGATHHITSDLELLTYIKCKRKTDRYRVHLPTGEQVDITHIGSTILLDKRKIKDVLYVPNFKFNFLSVAKLTKELKFNANFFLDLCVFQDLWNGKVKGIGKERGGLYVLRGPASRIKALNSISRASKDSELLTGLGIIHQSSCPYTPQQNGIVERRNRYILDTAKALKFQGVIPIRYWGMCVKTTVYLINRLPSSVLGGKTPYELLYHKKANIAHLRVMGCLCYATNLVKTDKDIIFKESEFLFAKKDGSTSLDAQEYIEQGALQFSPLHTQPGSSIYDRNVSTSTAEDMGVQDNRHNDLQENLPALQETNTDGMQEVSQNVEDMCIVHAGQGFKRKPESGRPNMTGLHMKAHLDIIHLCSILLSG